MTETTEKPERFISEVEVSKALDFLRDSAGDIGVAVKEFTKAEKWMGHVEAICFRASDEKSAEARKAEARCDPRYVEAIETAAYWAGEKAKLYSLREAASMKIEAWRSQQAWFRHTTRV